MRRAHDPRTRAWLGDSLRVLVVKSGRARVFYLAVERAKGARVAACRVV